MFQRFWVWACLIKMKHSRLSSFHSLMTFVHREWFWPVCCSTFSIFIKNTSRSVEYYWQIVHLWACSRNSQPCIGRLAQLGNRVSMCSLSTRCLYPWGRGGRWEGEEVSRAPHSQMWKNLAQLTMFSPWHSEAFSASAVEQEDVSSPSNILVCPPIS